MDLFKFTTFFGIILITLGTLFLLNRSSLNKIIRDFPRSKAMAFSLMTIGLVWFIYRHILNLSEADFGDYKMIIMAITLFIFASSFIFTKDFLAVRGLSIILLLFAREALDAAYLQEPVARLYFVSLTYIMIIFALYFGAWPYRLRDFNNWLFKFETRSRNFGYCIFISGIIMLASTLKY